jgi:arginyl-tRNA synthetase
MKIKEDIKKIVEKAIKKEGFESVNIQILNPKNKEHGDFSVSCALEIAKKENKNPIEVAEALQKRIKLGKDFSRVEVVKPGFINFFLSNNYLENYLDQILRGKNEINIGNKKRIQVEFVSANPTGPLTIGNARGGPFGDTLANVFKKANFDVEKAYYINDYGNQINSLGHSVLKDEEAKYKGEYIDFLHNRIGEEKDVYKIGKWASYIILTEIIKATIQKLNINYDEWFSETWLYEKGRVDGVLKELEKKDYVYEKDNAKWFKSEQFGDNRDRVLIKTDGKATYLLGDLAYHEYKFKDKKFEKVINVWGADHAGDVMGLKSGVWALGFKDKLDIVLLQFVTILDNKGEQVRMSKRAGNYVTMDDLLNDVPTDVVRFFFLQKSANTHLNFNFDLAREESEKNPVYYIQYAYARICSVLDGQEIKKGKNLNLLKEEEELELIKQLLKFEEIIEDTVNDYGVHRIPQYAIDLAGNFHKFYSKHRILNDDKKLSEARLGLVYATKKVLKDTLKLMGISAPEKM